MSGILSEHRKTFRSVHYIEEITVNSNVGDEWCSGKGQSFAKINISFLCALNYCQFGQSLIKFWWHNHCSAPRQNWWIYTNYDITHQPHSELTIWQFTFVGGYHSAAVLWGFFVALILCGHSVKRFLGLSALIRQPLQHQQRHCTAETSKACIILGVTRKPVSHRSRELNYLPWLLLKPDIKVRQLERRTCGRAYSREKSPIFRRKQKHPLKTESTAAGCR